jgi:hypothetical protein
VEVRGFEPLAPAVRRHVRGTSYLRIRAVTCGRGFLRLPPDSPGLAPLPRWNRDGIGCRPAIVTAIELSVPMTSRRRTSRRGPENATPRPSPRCCWAVLRRTWMARAGSSGGGGHGTRSAVPFERSAARRGSDVIDRANGPPQVDVLLAEAPHGARDATARPGRPDRVKRTQLVTTGSSFLIPAARSGSALRLRSGRSAG